MQSAKDFLKTPSAAHWKRIGAQRRAGVALPLFFIQSKKSIGVGELTDLEPFAEWCAQTGLSLIQLLPLNDVGFNFRPYDSESSFALEPMFLCLEKLSHVPLKEFSAEIDLLRKKFPSDTAHFNTDVKIEKLKLLRKMYSRRASGGQKDFEAYRERESAWLEPYTLFKVLKAKMNGLAWEAWPDSLKDRDEEALNEVRRQEKDSLEFQAWLQWQLYIQLRAVADTLRKKGVRLLGDIPFLVSRDSADVWSQRQYFKLYLSSGAPPDLYFADGQQWGMPPYHWQALEAAGYDYFEQKLKYAENFYDLYRVDHFVGIFRVWTYPRAGGEGSFDPPDEFQWEPQGRKILSMMLSKTKMLPCAEDLGTVPECSYRVLKEFGIPGMEIQRWMRDWGNTWDFKNDSQYRLNSISTLSTHDMAPFEAWWEFEAGRVETQIFEKKCLARGIDFGSLAPRLFDLKRSAGGRAPWRRDVKSVEELLSLLEKSYDEVRDLVDWYLSTYDEKNKFWTAVGLSGKADEKSSELLVKHALMTICKSSSVFSINSLQDWLSLGGVMGKPKIDLRINEPGTVNDKNWRLRMPKVLEELKKLSMNRAMKALIRETLRA